MTLGSSASFGLGWIGMRDGSRDSVVGSPNFQAKVSDETAGRVGLTGHPAPASAVMSVHSSVIDCTSASAGLSVCIATLDTLLNQNGVS
jgi:hypothetical protein